MDFDLIVIGSGPGGYVAAIRAAQLGMKTAIIEKEHLGGICLNWGCIPTKSLLKSANTFHSLKHAEDYGLIAENIHFDFLSIIKRSRNLSENMRKGINFLMRKNKIEVIFGRAKIHPGKKVIVFKENEKECEYTSQYIILATGARSINLTDLPQDGKKIIDYRQALVLSELPKRMMVVGSGAIGVEFAYFYNTLGTKVTLIEKLANILPTEDSEISQQLELSFKKSGIEVLTSSSVFKVDTSGKDLKVSIKGPKQERIIETDVVLSAVGVTPNVELLGLEEVGIKMDRRGSIIVDHFYRTNIDGYYAIGDVVHGPALAHVASYEGLTCVEHIQGMDVEPIDYGNIPSCIYCSPEIASVGLTEKETKEKGYDTKVGKFPFSALGKSTINGENEGFIKVIFDAKYGEWLGCHIIGTGVTDIITEAVIARKLETTSHEILKSIHPHPTLSEAIMEAVSDAYGTCIHI
ncbi:MAG: dihydrolipoyl dehydrogenase [Candidatus Walczuchella monophlebidarum]